VTKIYIADVLNPKNSPTQVPCKPIEGKQRECGAGGSNDPCCYNCSEAGHPARTCPNKVKFLAEWNGKTAPATKGTEKKEKEKQSRRRGLCGGRKKGS
jgi:hypothetical protein